MTPQNVDAVPHDGVTELDIIKIALSVVAGIGGTVALVVAYRRQHQLERDEAGHRERDKAYRDRYASAAQQLGDPQPAVRLAGVYAMANLADQWLEQRQQCVDVLCAYLRLPWGDVPNELEPGSTTTQHSWPAGESQHSVSRTYPGRAGEREVRRTLIRVITDHLQADAALNWSNLDFDLRQAHLPDARLTGAHFTKSVTFIGARFSGVADFAQASFSDRADFSEATFSAHADFMGATFSAHAYFTRATFSAHADFMGATFSALSYFAGATFSTLADFAGATFSTRAVFDGATFSGADFGGATFFGAGFVGATFTGTSFSGATFSGIAEFAEASFAGVPDFSRAAFSTPPRVDGVHLPLGVDLDVIYKGEIV